MSIDGTWGFIYWGDAGLGIGVIVIRGRNLIGSDNWVTYCGTVDEDPASGELVVQVDMDIPAGVWLVGGAGAMDVPSKRSQSFRLPARLGDSTPIEVPIRPGKTMAVFRPVPEEWAAYATGFQLVPTPRA
jgi:hypothetical protein